MLRSCHFTLLLLVLSITVLFGQKFESVNDKFPFARVNCIYQDNYGFLWFGTRDGLVKYDGYSARHFRKIPGDPQSLPGPEVNAVCQISDSLLLIGMQINGAAILNRNTGQCRRLLLKGHGGPLRVYSLLVTSDSDVMIGTDNGIFSCNECELNTLSPNDFTNLLVEMEVTQLYQDSHGTVWVGTDKGIFTVVENEFVKQSSASGELKSHVVDIVEDHLGVVWLSVADGTHRIYKWNRADRVFVGESKYGQDGVFEMAIDGQGNMWAISDIQGVFKYEPDKTTALAPEKDWQHGFRALFAREIACDKYNNIWIAGNRVFQLSGGNKNFQSVKSNGFHVISIYADEESIYYCAQEPMRWSRQTGIAKPFMKNVEFKDLVDPVKPASLKRIYRFQPVEDGIVMSSIRNVFIWDKSTDQFTQLPSNLEGAFRDFLIDKDGNVLLTGAQGMPSRLSLSSGEYELCNELSEVRSPVAVAQSRNGVQWWGNSDHGLIKYDPAKDETKVFVPEPESKNGSISSFGINDVLCHSNGDIWAATKFGLNRIYGKSEEVEQFLFDPGQANMHIASILEDNRGDLWLGTQNGIVYFDPDSKSVKRYTKADGLINTVYTPRACYKDEKGCLYFGGDGGIDYFFPEEIGTNAIAPDVYLKAITVGNHTITDSIAGESISELTLDYWQNTIEIELLPLHLVSPEANVCSYRLPLQSEEWIALGYNRTINLANLSPGKYILEGRCANADGIWSQPISLLTLNIAKPYWQTFWFVSLVGLFLLFGVLAVYRVRIRQLKKSARLKHEFTRQIAELEMKALRAQMNPHFLFNSLNSVSLLIDKGMNTEAKRYLAKYSELIRQILNNSRQKFIRLDEELETLRLYLDLEQIRFKNFTYCINVDDNVEADFIEIPPLLLQPYVENALWHGLMNKQEGERELLIAVTKDERSVRIRIEDNGIGRAQAQLIKSRNGRNRESLGAKISEDRLMYLKEVYGRDVFVEVDDLENPSGTRVTIGLPLSD